MRYTDVVSSNDCKGTSIDIANDPLGSQDVTIDLKPGTYEFFCKYHVQSGMKGTLTVT